MNDSWPLIGLSLDLNACEQQLADLERDISLLATRTNGALPPDADQALATLRSIRAQLTTLRTAAFTAAVEDQWAEQRAWRPGAILKASIVGIILVFGVSAALYVIGRGLEQLLGWP